MAQLDCDIMVGVQLDNSATRLELSRANGHDRSTPERDYSALELVHCASIGQVLGVYVKDRRTGKLATLVNIVPFELQE